MQGRAALRATPRGDLARAGSTPAAEPRHYLFAFGRALQLSIDLLDARQPLPFGKPDQTNALRIAPHDRHFIDGRAHQCAGGN